MLAGASTVFFSYIGFDSVASTAEEVLFLTFIILIDIIIFSILLTIVIVTNLLLSLLYPLGNR